jgi:hypothetical protein
MARTRAHIFAPLISPEIAVLDFVTLGSLVQFVAVIGSGLTCTS